MKKSLALLLVVILAMTMTACAGTTAATTTAAPAAAEATTAAPAATETTAAAKKVVAGVVFQEDQFMKLLQLGYVAAAKEAGYECLTANTASDATKEAELINTYIAQKVAGIAISPVSEATSIAPLEEASKAGVKIALSNTNIDKSDFIVGGYTSDNFAFCSQTGAVAAEYIKKNMNGEAKIGILQFKSLLPEQSSARVDGFKSELDKAGIKYEIVADQDAWLQDKAVAAIGDMMTANPEINLIFAANEGGTIGAALGLDNAGFAGKVVVFGTDASEQIVDLLKDKSNILQAVTGQDPYGIGFNTMKALINALEGGDISETQGKTIIVPGSTLRRDDVAGLDTFIADLKAKMG
jgi:ABC-type sugar transport system substrate-binding protein